MRRLPLLLLAALTIGAAPPPTPAPAYNAGAANRLRAHVEFLASDLLEGRELGSRGHEIAAAYVAAEFRELGLKPGGDNGGWYQQVPFRRAMHVAPPRMTLTVAGQRIALRPGLDSALAPSVLEKTRRLNSPLVFVGYGLSDRINGIDDYRGLDVRGKTVVVLEGTPPNLPNEVAAHLFDSKEVQAASQGATGFILVGRGGPMDAFNRSAIDWVDARGQAGTIPRGLRFSMRINDAVAEKLFARAPLSLSRVRARAAKGDKSIGFALPASIAIDTQSRWEDFTSPAVIGVVPGADRRLAGEHVVLMGHLDHLGIDATAKPGADRIYNGALDNAAGVATLIETARSFVESGRPPRRSVMFIANTGEEDGLLGASYFASHPTVPASGIVGVVDLDMPLLLYDFRDVIAFGGDHSSIGKIVASAGAGMGVTVSPDPMPAETLFVRSDHYPFVKRGIPAVFLMTGWKNGGQQVWSRFLAGAYHSVKDDVAQPIRWDAGARFAELNYRIARTMADSEQRPLWYRGDYFGETFAPGGAKTVR